MKARSIHLIGICGTAMASLAGMLKARGLDVRGSDAAAYPPMSTFLESLGIPVMQPWSEQNLSPAPDVVVVGNAISRGNPELEYLLDERLPFVSMPEVIHQEFIRGHNSLVIAGTHGKTTTTSMTAWIFEFAGRNPSFLIGGIAENFGSSFAVTDGKEFIIEGDEYDTAFFDKGPKFLHYFPDSVILTSVEFDHADIYRDLEAVKFAFRRLVNLVPRRGRVIAWDGSENISECLEKAFCPVERYGFHEDSFWRIRDVQYEAQSTRWTVDRDGRHFADFEFPLAGEYNVLNATAAAALADSYGIPAGTIAGALRGFLSVKRRLEVRAEVDGVTVIDDFAHHPTAIAATLTALRKRYTGRRLWAILEPRSNTLRRNVFEHELVESLALADQVVIASVFFKTTDALKPEERLDVDTVVAELGRRGIAAQQLPDVAAIVSEVAPKVASGDVVAILSNGGFGGIYEKLPEALERTALERKALERKPR
ncbi:MAG TPA: UDP-N-acetylmuramate:L-alanyl-gamma-D-glutamyl-meso-diaminopimelate ligase [Candidatus Saccharimonadales bacterium]|nr:UDP-N-acetylmuramate:L-alanyl-gamma-D-glutamyl-meso-diaminopimelate ligase [Candidatus Saccharimonadales bacterium]